MPLTYKIVPEHNCAYIKVWGEVSVDEIMTEGAKMFAETEWKNGFNILCDYREITDFDLDRKDIEKVINQDRQHEPIFDKSKCAIVANADLVYGFSRMWEILSGDIELTRMVFRDINDAQKWLGLDSDFLDSMNRLP